MKILFLFVGCLLPAVQSLYAQLPLAGLSAVPDSIKTQVSVIVQEEDDHFEVTDIDRATYTSHYVETVLDERGKYALRFAQRSDKFESLTDAEIKVYNAEGKQTARYKKRDMVTEAYDGDGLIEDGEVTRIKVNTPDYPVTMEVTYTVRQKGTLWYPSFDIQSPGQYVVHSTFEAKVPPDLDLRYKNVHTGIKPVIGGDAKFKTYAWTVDKLPPVKYEEGTGEYQGVAVSLAPNRFKMQDYEGDMSTWKGFGAWEYNLEKGLNVLPGDRVAFFKELTRDAKTDREKVARVYHYLQSNFRYVSIQLGIGGWKPFPASFTDAKKYGDCKALSYYMHAVLSSLGIKSYTALVNAGYNSPPVSPAFPCNQFNHVILCVPLQKDSIWLECTSKYTDFDVLSSFTENRYALLVTENGGVLVPTPKSRPSENKFYAHTVVRLADDGSGTTHTGIYSTGEFKFDFLTSLFDEKQDDQKRFLVDQIGFKQPDEFKVSKVEDSDQLSTDVDLAIEQIPEFMAGDKMFLSPRIYKLYARNLPKAEDRQLDYYFPGPFDKSDTTVFRLPDGFTVDALPQPKDLKCKDASYTTSYWYDQNKKAVYSTARLVLSQYRIPSSRYADVRKFFDAVLQDDSQRIVIRKE